MMLVDMTGSGWALRDNVKNDPVQRHLTPLHYNHVVKQKLVNIRIYCI